MTAFLIFEYMLSSPQPNIAVISSVDFEKDSHILSSRFVSVQSYTDTLILESQKIPFGFMIDNEQAFYHQALS
ncbi:hypothetical protein QG37_03588 [Candidozyma auris]|nr:hypothetical protein QG37_03588 [[Candida] auris]